MSFSDEGRNGNIVSGVYRPGGLVEFSKPVVFAKSQIEPATLISVGPALVVLYQSELIEGDEAEPVKKGQASIVDFVGGNALEVVSTFPFAETAVSDVSGIPITENKFVIGFRGAGQGEQAVVKLGKVYRYSIHSLWYS